MTDLDILIPTADRVPALAVTLTGLLGQDYDGSVRLLIADQSKEQKVTTSEIIRSLGRLLDFRGMSVEFYVNLPAKGIAHNHHFLLTRATAPYVLFLDDDIYLEPYVISLLLQTIQRYECGFVGSAQTRLSHITDVRPFEQDIEFWNAAVLPEKILPGSPEWQRYKLNNAANIKHIELKYGITPAQPRIYKVAWIGSCVLYHTQKLWNVGGFSFWEQLPDIHSGENVYAQLKVMERYGGCGVLPSGAYHLELPTTILDRDTNIPDFIVQAKKGMSN